ncbi:MAG TPA: hypothetical protein VML94_05855 [Thermoplasmata archaeon]|nr:hypothetical protein [Thermoplasmata archaeon]
MDLEKLSARIAILLVVLAAIVLGSLAYVGKLDPYQSLTDLAFVLLTLAFSLILVQTILGRYDRLERKRRTRQPLSRITVELGNVRSRILREFVAYYQDEDLVHEITDTVGVTVDVLTERLQAKITSTRGIPANRLDRLVRDLGQSLDQIRVEVRQASPNLPEDASVALDAAETGLAATCGPLRTAWVAVEESNTTPEREIEAGQLMAPMAGVLVEATSFAAQVERLEAAPNSPKSVELIFALVARSGRR